MALKQQTFDFNQVSVASQDSAIRKSGHRLNLSLGVSSFKSKEDSLIASSFLGSLSDRDLILETKLAIKTEREATAVVVRYLKEIKERELYLKEGCSSLFQFVTERLGYCGASAQARISAMELISALPEVEKKIESGELSLTAAAKVQTFFKAEKKLKKVYSAEAKLEVIEECLSKSTREVERELSKRNPDSMRYETVKPVGVDRFELRFSISEELEGKLQKLKGLLAHSNPNMSNEELLGKLVELGLEKFDPERKAQRAEARAEKKALIRSDLKDEKRCEQVSGESDFQGLAEILPAAQLPPAVVRAHEVKVETEEQPSVKSRYIPSSVRHHVWIKNAGEGCEYVSDSGQRCGSRHLMQLDHIQGFAIGGESTAQNLRVVCAKHNRLNWKMGFERGRARM